MEIDELYQDIILDHYKNPRCYGRLDEPQATSRLYNPLCGDEVELYVSVSNDSISEISFECKGCSISKASASLMSELCKGQSLGEVHSSSQKFQEMLKGNISPEQLEDLGDARVLEGVSRFPARVRCAMLPWEALEKCIKQVES